MLQGGCHCGAVTLGFDTAVDIAAVAPRACDCSFCCMHGAAYVSDSVGALRAVEHRPGALQRYRQGAQLAEFLLCRHCGVLLGAVYAHDAGMHAAVNYRCLQARDSFAASVTASPQQLGPEEKVARWKRLWIAKVEIVAATISPP